MNSILDIWRGGDTKSKVSRGLAYAVVFYAMSQGWLDAESLQGLPEPSAFDPQSIFAAVMGSVVGSMSSEKPEA